jgi:hypothetical protein
MVLAVEKALAVVLELEKALEKALAMALVVEKALAVVLEVEKALTMAMAMALLPNLVVSFHYHVGREYKKRREFTKTRREYNASPNF